MTKAIPSLCHCNEFVVAMEKKTVFVNVAAIAASNYAVELHAASVTTRYVLLPPLRDSNADGASPQLFGRCRTGEGRPAPESGLGLGCSRAALPLIVNGRRVRLAALRIFAVLSPGVPCPRGHDDHPGALRRRLRIGSTDGLGSSHRAGLPPHPGRWACPIERHSHPHRSAVRPSRG